MKIIIVKLGAKGDVLRTVPVVRAIKEKYAGKIIWVTKENAKELLHRTDFIDEVRGLPFSSDEEFDLLFNFDIEDAATELAERLTAKKKLGFCKNEGFVSAYNLGAEYYLNTLFDDDVKKINKKTYQEMMFEVAEIDYKKNNYGIVLTDSDREYAKNFFSDASFEKLIGVHLGASPRWPSKAWHEDNLKRFVALAKKNGFEILLFGGPDEANKLERVVGDLRKEKIEVLRNDFRNSDVEFASLIERCDFVVCGDSFALHVALALKKKTVGMFFCTSPDEVEGYGLLKKIVSSRLYDFFPERMDEYDEELVKSISAEDVLLAVLDFENN